MNKGHWIATVLILAFLVAIATTLYVAFVPAQNDMQQDESAASVQLGVVEN